VEWDGRSVLDATLTQMEVECSKGLQAVGGNNGGGDDWKKDGDREKSRLKWGDWCMIYSPMEQVSMGGKSWARG
jgi:hypothetical protein